MLSMRTHSPDASGLTHLPNEVVFETKGDSVSVRSPGETDRHEIWVRQAPFAAIINETRH